MRLAGSVADASWAGRSSAAGAALLLVLLGCIAQASDVDLAASAIPEEECNASSPCQPASFLKFGSWVLQSAKLIARCDGYQAIAVHANGTDMLFLDESARPAPGATRAAEQGMPFGEFNEYHAAYDIESVSCDVLDQGKVKISGTASNHHDDSKFQFRIVADTTRRTYTYEDTTGRSSAAYRSNER
ncbi:hypothetical protein HNQ60_001785 [Povalibacter uvarum]|uniref:Uncharacterized protein n=1 Tax=Povalibacter uvarum TaxID=732238 RepID=A0A841HIR5_9GAMM|nr:hypothetical protein [Povalibacter uvarum]MBB6092907.1 hypothetical protein [Povalibacter uvarum]